MSDEHLQLFARSLFFNLKALHTMSEIVENTNNLEADIYFFLVLTKLQAGQT